MSKYEGLQTESCKLRVNGTPPSDETTHTPACSAQGGLGIFRTMRRVEADDVSTSSCPARRTRISRRKRKTPLLLVRCLLGPPRILVNQGKRYHRQARTTVLLRRPQPLSMRQSRNPPALPTMGPRPESPCTTTLPFYLVVRLANSITSHSNNT